MTQRRGVEEGSGHEGLASLSGPSGSRALLEETRQRRLVQGRGQESEGREVEVGGE